MRFPHLVFGLAVAGLGTAALAQTPTDRLPGVGVNPALPQPAAGASARKFSQVVGWPADRTPRAPAGFRVLPFAKGLDSPRWVHILPNGDVLVAEARSLPRSGGNPVMRQGLIAGGSIGISPNRIILLRDADRDGVAETRHVLLSNLNQPFGMALVGDSLYVANTDGVMRFPYVAGQTRIDDPGTLIFALPAGGYNNHWTRNLLASPDGSKLYVSVGSASNVGENGMNEEAQRANILQINLDGSNEKIFASGLRNPVGMAWEPRTGRLWSAVNERDGLGDDLVPDYVTSIREGGFYGWPYSYHGRNPDPRQAGAAPELVARAITPDFALGSHTASLGLAFQTGSAFPTHYAGGAFVAQRGSWNRSEYSGYKVVFIPFRDGKPSGQAEDFLTGFMADARSGEAYGRPVGVFTTGDGALLVSDDAGNAIWRVEAELRAAPSETRNRAAPGNASALQ